MVLILIGWVVVVITDERLGEVLNVDIRDVFTTAAVVVSDVMVIVLSVPGCCLTVVLSLRVPKVAAVIDVGPSSRPSVTIKRNSRKCYSPED